MFDREVYYFEIRRDEHTSNVYCGGTINKRVDYSQHVEKQIALKKAEWRKDAHRQTTNIKLGTDSKSKREKN